MSEEPQEALSPEEEARRAEAEDLARRLQEGDPEAEDALVRRFSPGLSYLLRHLTGDPALAEDLLQETFAIALPRLRAGELRELSKMSAFLRGTAKNLVRAGRRKGRRRAAAGEAELPENPTLAPEPQDPTPGPLHGLLLGEEAALARRLLSEMPSQRDGEVLFRIYVAEEDRESICRDLDLTGQQLNLVLFRARRRYRELWQAAMAERERGDPGRRSS